MSRTELQEKIHACLLDGLSNEIVPLINQALEGAHVTIGQARQEVQRDRQFNLQSGYRTNFKAVAHLLNCRFG